MQHTYAHTLTRIHTHIHTPGYLFAKEAWKRIVGEGGAQIGGDHQSLASLKKSKETVKRELKLFEVQFEKFYGRLVLAAIRLVPFAPFLLLCIICGKNNLCMLQAPKPA